MNSLKRIIRNFKEVLNYIGRRQIASYAAAAAFWFFVSLVPIVTLCAAILPYTSVTEAEMMQAVSVFFPTAFTALMQSIVNDVYSSRLPVISISLIASLWMAGAGFSSLLLGLENINEKKHISGFFMRRFRGILFTVGMLLTILVSILLIGFGHTLPSFLASHLPFLEKIPDYLIRFRILPVILILTLFFSAIFEWGSRKHSPLREVLPGALLAAVAWSLFTWAFSAWIAATGSYGTYGSLATVVIAMLWIFYCQYILLLAACFNRALPKFTKK